MHAHARTHTHARTHPHKYAGRISVVLVIAREGGGGGAAVQKQEYSLACTVGKLSYPVSFVDILQCLFTGCFHSEFSLPPELQSHAAQVLSAYQHALHQGRKRLQRQRIIIIGDRQTGKELGLCNEPSHWLPHLNQVPSAGARSGSHALNQCTHTTMQFLLFSCTRHISMWRNLHNTMQIMTVWSICMQDGITIQWQLPSCQPAIFLCGYSSHDENCCLFLARCRR